MQGLGNLSTENLEKGLNNYVGEGNYELTGNDWWGTTEQVRTLYGDTYANAGYSEYPNYFAATGMRLNFKEIPFKASTSATENSGIYSKINGKTEEDLTGSEFIASEYAGKSNIEVHNLTLEELNEARGESETSTTSISTDSGDTGLFYLRGLESENVDYKYTSSISTYYWLGSPGPSYPYYVYYMNYDGTFYNGYGETLGIRPVVSITGVKMGKDESGLWKISE